MSQLSIFSISLFLQDVYGLSNHMKEILIYYREDNDLLLCVCVFVCLGWRRIGKVFTEAFYLGREG